jgi:hypothetical protein
MARILDGINPGAYLGVKPATPPNMIIPGNIPLSSPRSPTNNDIQYNLGDLWLNKTNQTLWYLAFLGANNAGRYATWLEFATGAGGAVISLTTDDGHVVTALAGTIIIHGAGGLVTSGTVGPNTVTITAGPTIATSYITNPVTGAAVPALGVLTFAGAGGIVVSAAGSTVTITGGAGTVSTLHTDDGNNVTATAGVINIHGINGIVVTGTVGPNTVTLAAGGAVAQSFPTDAGTAVPIAGVLNIKANNGTDNSGSTVSFSAPGPANTVLLNVTNANATTIIGLGAGNATITGANDTILGSLSGTSITSAAACTIIGENSATQLLTGSNNVIVGQASGNNYTGAEANNILIGRATSGRLTASGEIKIGSSAGFATNNNDIFIGNGTGPIAAIPGGYLGQNIGIGGGALAALTTGFYNIAIGVGSLASQNIGIGNNVMVGNASGTLITSGVQNTAVGHDVLFNAAGHSGLVTGSFNCAFGVLAGSAWTGAESNNICIGDVSVTGENRTTRIGAFAGGSTPQTACFIQGIRGITTVNNNAVAVLVDSAGQLGTISSSRRYKSDIQDMGIDSDKIMQLRPVSFKFHGYDNRSVGLIAEEVEEIMPELVAHDKDGVIFSCKYQDLIPMLLNELQKLKKEVELLKSK